MTSPIFRVEGVVIIPPRLFRFRGLRLLDTCSGEGGTNDGTLPTPMPPAMLIPTKLELLPLSLPSSTPSLRPPRVFFFLLGLSLLMSELDLRPILKETILDIPLFGFTSMGSSVSPSPPMVLLSSPCSSCFRLLANVSVVMGAKLKSSVSSSSSKSSSSLETPSAMLWGLPPNPLGSNETRLLPRKLKIRVFDVGLTSATSATSNVSPTPPTVLLSSPCSSCFRLACTSAADMRAPKSSSSSELPVSTFLGEFLGDFLRVFLRDFFGDFFGDLLRRLPRKLKTRFFSGLTSATSNVSPTPPRVVLSSSPSNWLRLRARACADRPVLLLLRRSRPLVGILKSSLMSKLK
mmetsp:Transcript_43766/g.105556  ORF Transcript_43766/g.105556 Transcript_43766/m.105556 type:complete len:348 (+) Transcript_43766:474-1517(+)